MDDDIDVQLGCCDTLATIGRSAGSLRSCFRGLLYRHRKLQRLLAFFNDGCAGLCGFIE